MTNEKTKPEQRARISIQLDDQIREGIARFRDSAERAMGFRPTEAQALRAFVLLGIEKSGVTQ